MPITFDAPGLGAALIALVPDWDAATIDSSSLTLVGITGSTTMNLRATATATVQTADVINVLNSVAGTTITPTPPASTDPGTTDASSS